MTSYLYFWQWCLNFVIFSFLSTHRTKNSLHLMYNMTARMRGTQKSKTEKKQCGSQAIKDLLFKAFFSLITSCFMLPYLTVFLLLVSQMWKINKVQWNFFHVYHNALQWIAEQERMTALLTCQLLLRKGHCVQSTFEYIPP